MESFTVVCPDCGTSRTVSKFRPGLSDRRCKSCAVKHVRSQQLAGTYQRPASRSRHEVLEGFSVSNSRPDVAARFTSQSPVSPEAVSVRSEALCEVACGTCGSIYTDRVVSVVRNTYCPTCRHWPRQGESLAELFPKTALNVASTSPNEARSVHITAAKELHIRCDECSREYRRKAKSFHFEVDPWRCAACTSRDFVPELHFGDWVEAQGVTVVRQSRLLQYIPKSRTSLDLYLPELNLAIEFNGDFIHSHEAFLVWGKLRKQKIKPPSERHRQKSELCKQVGVRLLWVWASEWMTRRTELEAALLRAFATGEVDPILLRTMPMDEPFEVGLFA